MPPTTAAPRRISPSLVIAALLVLICLIAAAVYLSRPAAHVRPPGPSAAATAYLGNLALSDIDMKATENFMKQQVVEIQGKIANNGNRTIRRIDVSCIFRDASGREIYRERVPVTQAAAFAPGETRSFRLPFDTLPEDWNQAMPTLVIAQIVFAN